MNKDGSIIIIEDSEGDRAMFSEVFEELGYENKIVFLYNGEEALTYLTAKPEEPFIVFSDINMPKLNGMELRQKIHENKDLRLKTIPYLFFTTSTNQEEIIDAYSQSVQGFFVKPSSFQGLKSTLKTIIEYWKKCESPNYVP